MSQTEDNPAKRPRFPYVATFLCAACVGLAVWLWTTYSYAWDVAPGDLSPTTDEARFRSMLGRYVELRGVWNEVDWGPHEGPGPGVVRGVVKEAGRSDKGVAVLMYDETPAVDQAPVTFKGRVGYIAGPGEVVTVYRFEVNASANRLTVQSTAGLITGVAGCCMFAVALRRWLRERKARRDKTEGPNNGVERTQDA